jgi:hypothetical protein
MDCQICCNKYTSKLRRKYTCVECYESACTWCVFKHMMGNLGDFKCLFCDNQILITDLREYLSASKYKQLADKEVKHLFHLEIGMLDATKTALEEEQRLVEMEVVTNWMRKDGMDDEQISQALTEMGYMKEESKKTLSLTHICPKCNNPLNHDKNTLEKELLKKSVHTCDSCKIKVCGLCIEERLPNHQCDKKVLDTLKHIRTTCETCPKCHVVIAKESGGCDQMFCTKCTTTFSWTTRRILTKGEVHHNPHFYEWQRQQENVARNPLDNPCEGHFLIKCQEELNDITILPETLATTTLKSSRKDKKAATDDPNRDVHLSIEKGTYLKFVQSMLAHSVETIVGIQEGDDFIRHQFRIRYLTKNLTFKRWQIRFKKHINTLRRNNETKTLLLACLDALYYITMKENGDTHMLEQLFAFITAGLKAVQKHYGRVFNYVISTENMVLPYMV